MDKLWAVAHMNYFDNELTIEFHRSNSWHGALAMHSKLQDALEGIDFTSQETAKKTCFDFDTLVDVKEVPSA